MKRVLWGILALLVCVGAIYAFELDRVLYPSMTPQEALQKLIDGNNRFIENKAENVQRASDIRAGLVSKQMPFAVILGCSDSRVPPELLFDQSVGDIFVVRVAGNVAGALEKASIGYAVFALKSKLIVVLGHENCGAVTAVMKKQTAGIEPIAELIQPAIDECREKCEGRLEDAIKMNVQAVVRQLKSDPQLHGLIRANKLDIVGGYYHLKSGKVDILGEEPGQLWEADSK